MGKLVSPPAPARRRRWTLGEALRTTARRLSDPSAPVRYRWTHMGACNCGHLAQTVTAKSPEELSRIALEKAGDWTQQAVDHCPASGLPMDDVLDQLKALGLSDRDLGHLEKLDDPQVLRRFPLGQRDLDFRSQADAARYLNAWAELVDG